MKQGALLASAHLAGLLLAVTGVLWLLWLAAAGLLSREAWFPPELRAYRNQPNFRERGERLLPFAEEARGWQAVPGGLAVMPGQTAVLRYRFDVDEPVAYSRLLVWARLRPDVDLAIEALALEAPADGASHSTAPWRASGEGAPDGGAPPTPRRTLFCSASAMCSLALGGNVPALRHLVGAWLTGRLQGASYDLAPLLHSHTRIAIEVRARNRGGGLEPVLEELGVHLAGPFWTAHHARLLYLLPLPALLGLAIGSFRTVYPRSGAIALVAGLLLAGALFLPASPLPWWLHTSAAELFWAATGAYGLAGALAAARAGALGPPPLLAGFAAAGITLWAFFTRLAALVVHGAGQLEPDARGYLGAAQSLSIWGLYAPLEREPLFPYLAHLWFLVSGATPVALRLLSLACSTGVVALTYAAGRHAVGTVPALLASAAVAAHPFLQWSSTRGLREDASLCLLLLLIVALYAPAGRPRLLRSLGAGALAGGLVLLRLDMLLVTLALLGYALLARRWPWRQGIVTLAVAAGLVAPYLWVNGRHHGDPFYAANLQARAFRNYEFFDLPGFPTREDMDRDQFLAGPPITWFGYYFGLHTPQDLAVTTAQGSVQIMKSVTFYTLPQAADAARLALALLLLLGVAVTALRPYRYLALAALVLLLQFAFLHVKAFRYSQVDPFGGVDARLFMTSVPFLALCVAAVPGAMMGAARRWLPRGVQEGAPAGR
jgi:hypothetical protein